MAFIASSSIPIVTYMLAAFRQQMLHVNLPELNQGLALDPRWSKHQDMYHHAASLPVELTGLAEKKFMHQLDKLLAGSVEACW